MLTITDSLDRDERAKRKFYKKLVHLLEERARIRPSDVFVMMTVTPPANFSYAAGMIGTDVEAAESIDAAEKTPGTRNVYSKAEMTYAVTQLFQDHNRGPILPMLSDDVVLSLPATLPYGGEFTDRATFDDFFAKGPAGGAVWKSFDIVVDDVIASDDHIIARLTNTAVPKATGKAVVFRTSGFSRSRADASSASSSTPTPQSRQATKRVDRNTKSVATITLGAPDQPDQTSPELTGSTLGLAPRSKTVLTEVSTARHRRAVRARGHFRPSSPRSSASTS